MTKLILFDGECNFCNDSVQFIIKRDPKEVFHFASLQSEIGRELLKQHQIPTDIDSLVYIKDQTAYTKSTAALRICQSLKGAWKLASLLILLPPALRDLAYDIIARNRYKWFGKKESCRLAGSQERKRFLS